MLIALGALIVLYASIDGDTNNIKPSHDTNNNNNSNKYFINDYTNTNDNLCYIQYLECLSKNDYINSNINHKDIKEDKDNKKQKINKKENKNNIKEENIYERKE